MTRDNLLSPFFFTDDEELSDDDDEYTYDLSAHFNKPRYSIKDQHVLIANIGSSFRVESGMRYFDPRNSK